MIQFREALVSQLHPNSYNPNVMSEEDYAKAKESIERFGFIDPITCRVTNDGFEIVDGENRWRAAKDKGLKTVPIIIVEADDDAARQLTIVLNELRGRPDATKLARLVADLATRRPMAELEQVLPFRRNQLAEMVSARRDEIDWDRLQQPASAPEPGQKERWLERVFRLPLSAAGVLDDAIERVREEDPSIAPWKALELICADFLSGR